MSGSLDEAEAVAAGVVASAMSDVHNGSSFNYDK